MEQATDHLAAKAVNRLNRIEGQVRGIRKMIEEGRYCIDVLHQIAAVHEALRGVGKLMMRRYLESCATNAIRSRDDQEAERVYEELTEVVYKYAR